MKKLNLFAATSALALLGALALGRLTPPIPTPRWRR